MLEQVIFERMVTGFTTSSFLSRECGLHEFSTLKNQAIRETAKSLGEHKEFAATLRLVISLNGQCVSCPLCRMETEPDDWQIIRNEKGREFGICSACSDCLKVRSRPPAYSDSDLSWTSRAFTPWKERFGYYHVSWGTLEHIFTTIGIRRAALPSLMGWSQPRWSQFTRSIHCKDSTRLKVIEVLLRFMVDCRLMEV